MPVAFVIGRQFAQRSLKYCKLDKIFFFVNPCKTRKSENKLKIITINGNLYQNKLYICTRVKEVIYTANFKKEISNFITNGKN